jgi:hypothetical protein
VYAVDVTAWPRRDAETSPERGFHSSSPCRRTGPPVVKGWAYQWIAQLSPARDSWTAPVDVRRVRPPEKAPRVAMEQVPALVARLPPEAQLAQQRVGPREEDGVAGPHRRRAQRLGQEGLPDAHRAHQQHVLLGGEDLQGKQFLEVAAVHLDGRRPVELLQRRPFLKAGVGEAALERLLVAALHLVGEQQRQEGGVVELLRPRPRQPLRQRRCQRPQLEPLVQPHQIGIHASDPAQPARGGPVGRRWQGAHGRAPPSCWSPSASPASPIRVMAIPTTCAYCLTMPVPSAPLGVLLPVPARHAAPPAA